MEHSPPEILVLIFSLLSLPDLKTLRLVCKIFDELVAPMIFDGIYINARYADLERATKVTSRFGPFIKTLVFSAQYFQRLSWEEHELPARHNPNVPGDHHMRKHYQAWRNLHQEQEEIGDIFKYLSHFLQVLTDLRKVVLTDSHRKSALRWCDQACIDGQQQLYKPWASIDLSIEEEVQDTSDKYTCLISGPVSAMSLEDSTIWPDLTTALYFSGNQNIKTLNVESPRPISNMAISAFSMGIPQAVLADSVFSQLTRIHLDLNVAPRVMRLGSEYEVFYEFAAARMLSFAVNVEDLELIGVLDGTESPTFGDGTDFKVLLNGCTFPKLRRFGMYGFTFTEAEMTSFLSCSPALHALCLQTLDMISGTWASLIDMIKGRFRLDYINIASPSSWTTRTAEGSALCWCTPSMEDIYQDDAYDFNPGLEAFFFRDGVNPFAPKPLQEVAKARRDVATARFVTSHGAGLPDTITLVPTSIPPPPLQLVDMRAARGDSIFGPFSPT